MKLDFIKISKLGSTVDNFIRLISLVLLFSLHTYALMAQTMATASVDRDTIKIGEHFNLTLQSESPEDSDIEWPKLLEKVGDFEIVDFTPINSEVKDGQVFKTQDIKLTIWDEGYHALPGLVFNYKNNNKRNKVQTEGKMITVLTLEVDTAKGMMPIKDIIEVPLTWKEILPIVLKYAAVAIFGLLLLFFAYRFFNKKEEIVAPPPPSLPAHEIALDKLKVIEKSKLWEKGSVKEYYSEVTETLREYVEKRFEVPALESTTDEILSDLNKTTINPSLTTKLTSLLEMADLVKFAKAKPGVDNHKKILKDAFVFVQHSKNINENKEQGDEV